MLGADAHPVPADGGRHGLHGLVLADDMAFKAGLQLAEALKLLLPDLGGGNLGPQLNDMGQILHGELGVALCQQAVQLRVEL